MPLERFPLKGRLVPDSYLLSWTNEETMDMLPMEDVCYCMLYAYIQICAGWKLAEWIAGLKFLLVVTYIHMCKGHVKWSSNFSCRLERMWWQPALCLWWHYWLSVSSNGGLLIDIIDSKSMVELDQYWCKAVDGMVCDNTRVCNMTMHNAGWMS